MSISPRVLLILTAFFVMASAAHATECLPSASAVWGAHPGSHATWRLRLPGHLGEKCWFAKSSTHLSAPRVRQARGVEPWSGTAYGEAERQTAGQTIRLTQVNASAADGPDKSTATRMSQDTLVASERGPLSILMWARPMHIDDTWEPIFAARERIGTAFAVGRR
jgi:hypothetical protein